MKKVNYNNMNGNLPKGQFYISNGTVSKDLNISIGKAKRLIKNFKRTKHNTISSIRKH